MGRDAPPLAVPPDFPDDDEPETRPDVRLVACPACKAEGTILHLSDTAIGYRSRRERCHVCRGRCFVDREAAERAKRATPHP